MDHAHKIKRQNDVRHVKEKKRKEKHWSIYHTGGLPLHFLIWHLQDFMPLLYSHFSFSFCGRERPICVHDVTCSKFLTSSSIDQTCVAIFIIPASNLISSYNQAKTEFFRLPPDWIMVQSLHLDHHSSSIYFLFSFGSKK